MNKPNIQVILGSIREGRSGIKVAEWFMDAVKEFKEANMELVDLKDYPMPLFADPISPLMRGTDKNPNPAVQKWLDKINSADGYVFVTAEYNHSVPGVFKNAIDYGKVEWKNKPVAFVGYGALPGGSRAVEHLRQITSELDMRAIHDEILIPLIWQAFDEQGNLAHGDSLAEIANIMMSKLTDLSNRLKAPALS